MWGGEAHLAVDVVLPTSISALTPPRPFFSSLLSNHLEWINISLFKETVFFTYKDLTCAIVEIRPSLTCL